MTGHVPRIINNISMATDAITLSPPNHFNDLTPEIRQDVLLSIQRLVRLAQMVDSGIEEKKLAWEVIRFLRQESGNSNSSNAELARAISGLMPQVNVQVNVERDERAMLRHKAENGLTERQRNIARQQLAKLDAQAGRQSSPAVIDAKPVEPDQTDREPIQAAEKLEG